MNCDNCDNYNNCDNCHEYKEMHEIINDMVKYECGDCGYCEDCMKNKISLNYKLQASNHERIIIQSKYSLNKDECSICFEELLNKAVSYLPCNHLFHTTCLNKTFENKIYNCPLCRLDLNDALTKINFKFPPPQPEPLSDLDIHVINQILNPINYLPHYYQPINRIEQMDTDITSMLLFAGDAGDVLASNTQIIDFYTFLLSYNFDNPPPPPLVSDSESETEVNV